MLSRRCNRFLTGLLIAFACVAIAGFCLAFMIQEALIMFVGDYEAYLPASFQSESEEEIAIGIVSNDTHANPGSQEKHMCHLPKCLLSGISAPHGMSTKETPQAILLTFDGPVTGDFVKLLTQQKLLGKDRKNPNGCPQAFTFFIADRAGNIRTSYTAVKEVLLQRHEIANNAHTMKDSGWWSKATSTDWEGQIAEQSKNLAHQLATSVSEVKGVRGPFLQTGGDTLFEIMDRKGLKYDSSLVIRPSDLGGPWPWTLDYDIISSHACEPGACPKASHPGIWEVPVTMWRSLDRVWEHPQNMQFMCPKNRSYALKTLLYNFGRHYKTNKSPFHIRIKTTSKIKTQFLMALADFLDRLVTLKNVYVISASQLIEWMENPQTLRDTASFSPWQKSCQRIKRNLKDK